MYDLRSPLGVPPAALTPLAELLPQPLAALLAAGGAEQGAAGQPPPATMVALGAVRASGGASAAALGPLLSGHVPALSLLCQQRYMRSRM